MSKEDLLGMILLKLPPKPTNSFLNMPLATPEENKKMQRNQPKRSSEEKREQVKALRAAREKSLSGQSKKEESLPELPETNSTDSQTSKEGGPELKVSEADFLRSEIKRIVAEAEAEEAKGK